MKNTTSLYCTFYVILLHNHLTSNEHIPKICLSLSKNNDFLIRSYLSFNYIQTFKPLYYTCVESRLGWYPCYTLQQLAIQILDFLKYLLCRTTGSYPDHNVDYFALLNIQNFKSLKVGVWSNRIATESSVLNR